MRKAAYVILVGILVITGCKTLTCSTEAPVAGKADEAALSEKMNPAVAGTFEILGTITHKKMEGGFYAIDGDDKRKYAPINLPQAFRKDGLKVKATARLKKDVMSAHMYGEIVEILNITLR